MSENATCGDGTERSLRAAVALDYIRDGQRHWNELDYEERHGTVEMARWALEDADEEDLEAHIWHDDSLKPDRSEGTDIECGDCGHVRETTEENPTLVNCEKCGSCNLRYVGTATDDGEVSR